MPKWWALEGVRAMGDEQFMEANLHAHGAVSVGVPLRTGLNGRPFPTTSTSRAIRRETAKPVNGNTPCAGTSATPQKYGEMSGRRAARRLERL